MKKLIIFGAAALIVLGGGYAIYQNIYGPTNDAMDAVRAQLLDGDSAKFRNVRALNGASVCGEVNAKNRMGAYVGFSEFYVIAPSDDSPYVRIAEENETACPA